jgi:hypothetical protein
MLATLLLAFDVAAADQDSGRFCDFCETFEVLALHCAALFGTGVLVGVTM